jgi:cyanophycin synthetase
MREGEGTWLGHVLEHVAIELQNVAGEDVTFGKTRSIDGRPGVYSVVYEYAQREEGIAAGELAMQAAVFAAAGGTETRGRGPATGWESARDGFIRYAQRRALGPSTRRW